MQKHVSSQNVYITDVLEDATASPDERVFPPFCNAMEKNNHRWVRCGRSDPSQHQENQAVAIPHPSLAICA